MTKSLTVSAFAGLVLALVGAAALYAPSGTSASPYSPPPSDPSVDLDVQVVGVYLEEENGDPAGPVTTGEIFWVTVEFTIKNHGTDAAIVNIAVEVMAPPGCEPVPPGDGLDTFIHDQVVKSGDEVTGFSRQKFRCTTAGDKEFVATVSTFPSTTAFPFVLITDPNTANNSRSATSLSLEVTGDPCPQSVLPLGDGPSCPSTPTPVPTPTPTPVGQTPSPTPVPTPQGDVDCDGDVDAVDPLKGLQHISAIEFSQEEGCPQLGVALPAAVPAGDPPVLFGDVDCDADVDAVDELKILRFLVGFSVSQTEPCPDIGTPLGIGGSGSPLSHAVPVASAVVGLFALAGVVRVSTRSRGR